MANGHRSHDVWDYTLRAVQVYVTLIVSRQRSELHALTVAVRHTQGADNKVFKEFLTSLTGDE